jgi:perosamine synthetase
MPNFTPISQPSITQKEVEYVTDAIQSGWVSSLGKYIDLFEDKFAQYCGTQYALTTSNGTVALHLALVSLGIKEGDEVIIPDLTFIATANAVKYTGATVISIDIEENTLCISPKAIEAAITEKTKAIIPVHLYGHPASMSEINEIAKKYNLFVIEDAAEAHGAEINGKKVGGFGDCAIFSFYGNKIMTSGEGGMITTNNQTLYEKMKYLRDHAMSQEKRYWHTEIGFNYRMTNLQAALGLAQLERINDLINKKIEIFEWYNKELGNIANLQLNRTANWAKNVYWMICLEIDGYSETERNILMKKLKLKGIDSRPYFYPISDMSMYQEADTPITHNIYQQGINLPSYVGLTEKEVKTICHNLVEIIAL